MTYPSGISMILSWIKHFLAMSMTSSIVHSGFPYYKLKRMESLKRIPFCGMMEILFLKLLKLKSFKFWPSM